LYKNPSSKSACCATISEISVLTEFDQLQTRHVQMDPTQAHHWPSTTTRGSATIIDNDQTWRLKKHASRPPSDQVARSIRTIPPTLSNWPSRLSSSFSITLSRIFAFGALCGSQAAKSFHRACCSTLSRPVRCHFHAFKSY